MPCSKPLMAKLAEKLEWDALRSTVGQLDWGVNLPEAFEEAMLDDEQLLTDLHLLLLKRQILEGTLTCPNCERVYEIKTGIPNMLLNEDEV